MLNHTFTFNGHSSDEFGIRIERFPDLNRSARKFRSASVSGRNGNIYQFENAWEEVTVSYQIFAGERQEGAAVADFTEIVEWLNSADDYAVLTDSYDPEHYRLAVFVDEMEIESEWHTFGKATVRFRCRPQRFIVEEPIAVASGGSVANPTNHIAKPIITLTGSGSANLIDLRNKTASTSSGSLPVGSRELSVLIKAFNDGTIWWVRQNPIYTFPSIQRIGSYGGTVSSITASSGNIVCTPSSDYGIGLVASVKPDTDYYFQAGGTGQPTKVEVWFGASDAYNTIIGKMESTSVTGFTFHTPTECAYVLIGLYSTSGQRMTWNNIMLSSGTSRKTFRPYVDSIANNFTLGNTALQFSLQSFGEAVIDCERENFTVDGAEMNGISSVQDQYGNLSVNYLQLAKGDNAASFSGDIASVTIDRRIWQL